MFRRTTKQNNPQQAATTNPTEGRYSYFYLTLNYSKCLVFYKNYEAGKEKKRKFVSLTRGKKKTTF